MPKGLESRYKGLSEALNAVTTAEERLFALLGELGIDIASPQYEPKKRKKARRKPTASRLKGESILVLKVRGKALRAVASAGYRTFESLNGKSKKLLKRHPGVGDGILATLEAAMKKRGMAFRK
jgi:hypothetical protein